MKTKEPEPLQHPEITFVPNPYATTLGPVYRAQTAKELLLKFYDVTRTAITPDQFAGFADIAVEQTDALIKALQQ